MKILQIIASLNTVGGAEKFVMELSAALQKKGHDVTILSLYSRNNDFFDNFIKVNNLKVLYLNKKRGVDFQTSQKLVNLINEVKPDVIHGHVRFHLTLMLANKRKIKNIPFFETFHLDYATADENFIIKKYISKLYEKRIVEPVAISEEVKRTATKFFNIKREVSVIYNGIELPSLTQNIPIALRENEFITVSRLAPVKNHFLMIEAINKLVEKGHNPRLTIVGNGELFDEIRQKILEKKLENNIFLLGEKKDVFNHLISHKFFLLPSFSEGNPLSLLEAMACGLVPIVTNVGGAKDIVSEDNGYLVDPYDVNTLVKAMEEVILNPQKNEKQSVINFEKSKKYNIENTAKEYLKLFQNAI